MLDINKIKHDNDSQFVLAFDYDGVITKRGSSGENEEKWIKREDNILWRKLLNIVSSIYNRFFPINEDIVELSRLYKSLGCKILVISSHTLTTTDYKESKITRERVQKRLIDVGFACDDIIFVRGDKVSICKKLDVDLMIEDNVQKVKALRNGGISTVAKKNKKNRHLLEYDPDAIEDMTDLTPFVLNGLENKNFLEWVSKKIKDTDETSREIQDKKTKVLYADFTPAFESDQDVVLNPLPIIHIMPKITMKKLLLPQRKQKNK